jgi:Saccharopine dehydrogenase and related proteins
VKWKPIPTAMPWNSSSASAWGPNCGTWPVFAARWPGHCAFWRVMADLGLLEDEPLQFLVCHLAPRLQYRDNERDVAVLRVQSWGVKDGVKKRLTYEVIDYRDLETGLFAMNRTVGFTASIATQMVLAGEIRRPGVLSPIVDVPAERVLAQLEDRGIHVSRRVEDLS